MIVYFLESTKMYTFKLPIEVSGSYILSDYDSNGNKRSLVSVEARNGKWVIKDNDEVKIYSNSSYNEELELQLNSFYQLIICGTETVLMYVAEVVDNTFVCKSVVDNTTLTCGSGNCDISYSLSGFSSKQFQITYDKGQFYFKNLNPKIPLYVNRARRVEGALNNFDMLFIMGLKIFFLNDNIYINNPNALVILMSNKLGVAQHSLIFQDYKANSEFYKDFYEEKDYFFKTPVFHNAFEKLDLVLARPPEKARNRRDPLLLTIIPSALMSISSLLMGFYAFLDMGKKGTDLKDNLLTIIMCVTMLVSSVVWPFVERGYERIVDFFEEKRRKRIYMKYLKEKEKIFFEASKKQKAVLIGRYLSLNECRDAIINKTSNLFSRGYDSEYFLTVRLGIGNVLLHANIEYDKSEYDQIKDNLLDKAENLIKKYKYLDNSPYTVSLYENNILAFIGPNELKENFLNTILLQLIAYHSYTDLKIVVLSDTACISSLSYLKESNYCWNEDKSFRFFSKSFDEGQLLSEYLEKEFTVRLKKLVEKGEDFGKDRKNWPFYLIISDNISMYKNLKLVKDILEQKVNVGFGLVMFDSMVNNIPNGCSKFVNYTESECYYFTSLMNAENIQKFKPEFIGANYIDIDVEECIASVSNIPLHVDTNDSSMLPDALGFLEMYGVGKVEQLNCLQKWSTSNIVNSLATPIGVDTNGNILNLDLHEKKHGPHGLIAGMTGSGKSEFIITYILSLAVNYSPKEVQFVLIDYKGGGLAGAFENRKTRVKLPHLVGTITNLDKSEMKRTLVSIKSESQRRQRMFNEAKEKLNTGTIDIYKYQRLVRDGKLDVPLAHLFIICDEFAELKAQQPDFMDELVSTARIGRSLGIHLILATQKPSGVVDEQIWSNSKFKVCCKVQTTDDSNEMIRRDDAAYIKEAGRFYLQVGYDEYFVKGQSAYCGMSYVPSEKIRSKVSTGIDFINNLGDVIKSDVKEENGNVVQNNLGEELNNILNYIIEVAKTINFSNQQLWLDNIPKEIYLQNVIAKYNISAKPFELRPLIGEYDDPQNQLQGAVELALTTNGNTFVAGVAGSGKSTLLSTIIYSVITTHRVEEVNIFIIDLLNESLKKYSLAPQVGEVLTINEVDKIEKLFYFLQKISEKRKKHYSTNGGSFEQDVKNGKSIFPNILVFINGFDVFKERFETIYEDLFAPFSRDCNRNGITFIVTGVGINSLGYIAENNFPTTIGMKLLDASDYSVLFANAKVIPNSNPGRGLIKMGEVVYEFQTALPFEFSSFDTNLNYIIDKLNIVMPKKASKIPTIPNIVNISCFRNESISLSSIPIGIEIKSACPLFYNFDQLVNLITYNREQSIKNFVLAFVDLFSYLNNVKNIVLSAYDFVEISNENVKFYDANFKSVIKALYKNFSKAISDSENTNRYIITIVGYSKIMQHLNNLKEEASDEEISTIDDLILLTKDSNKIRFVIVDSCSLLTSIDEASWYNFASPSNGILVAAEFDNQSLFMAKDDYNNNSINRDEAIAIINGVKNYIKFVNK